LTTLYASLLQTALEEDSPGREEPLAQGVARLVASKARLASLGQPGRPAPAAERARATLEYDLCLIRLCGQLGVEHHFFRGTSFDLARERTEEDLMAQLPALVDVLDPPASDGLATQDTREHQENQ